MELYPEDLKTLLEILPFVESIASLDHVFEIEVRVRVDDTDQWAVLGYGESGDPCVLRFEPTKINAFLPHPNLPGIRGGFISTKPDGLTTINRHEEIS